MGSVYAARDRLKEEDVAIKVLRPDLLFSTAAKERFLAEARVSCSLSHPNIVRVHDVGVSGDHYYLSMERLKGSTLRQRIEAYRSEQRPFVVAEVTDIARQLIDALRYAHRSIVHRDLKPENVWLAEDGTVKLMDFGIARAFSASQLTQTGMTLGTAYYMAPEQRIAAKDVDWRADQYALGVVLYELLAGTLPTGAVTPLEALRRDLPKSYGAAVMRAMAAKPENRFASLDELWAQLSAPVSKRRVGVMIAIGAGLAAAVAGAFVVINRTAQAPGEQAPAAAIAPDDEPSPVAVDDPEPETAQPEVAATDTSGGASSPPPQEGPAANSFSGPATPVGTSTTSAPPASGGGSNAVVPAPRATPSGGSAASAADARRQQCIAQCDRDDGECRSINRRGRQECMRTAAFSRADGLTTTHPTEANCAFFGPGRMHGAHRATLSAVHGSARRHGHIEPPGLRKQGARIREDVPGRTARLPRVVLTYDA
jgi:serine/threonine protein kinase